MLLCCKRNTCVCVCVCVHMCVSTGQVLRSEVMGKMMLKAFLSDMPELRLGLNEAAEDTTFHQ